MVSQTSLFAWHFVSESLTKREKAVVEVLEQIQPATMQEVADHMGVPVHTISGRFTALAQPKLKFSEEVRPSLIHKTGVGINKYGHAAALWEIKK